MKTVIELVNIAAKAIKTITDETTNGAELICICALMESSARHLSNIESDKKQSVRGVETT